MKKLILTIIGCLCISYSVIAQTEALVPGSETINVSPDLTKSSKTYTIPLTFVLTGPAPGADRTVTLEIQGLNDALALNLDFASVAPQITIPKEKYTATTSTYSCNVVIKYNLPKFGLVNDIKTNIIVKGNPNYAVQCNFTGAKGNINDFWVEVGANFDLLDGLNANNLYSGIYAFEKDITHIGDHDISFTGGVYESKSSGLSASSDSGWIYRNGASYKNIPNKGYPIYRDTGSISTKTTVQSVGLFFSPHFKINQLSTKENGFHWYISFYFEMLWQRVKSNFDYSKTHTDTIMYQADQSGIYKFPYKETSINFDYRSHYFGFGIPVYLKHDDYTFYLNPVFGATSQKFAIIQPQLPINNVSDPVNRNSNDNSLLGFVNTKGWNTFYIAQFRLTSEKYGISVTGEVRGFFLAQTKPIISLAISKKFDLGTFFGNSINKGNE